MSKAHYFLPLLFITGLIFNACATLHQQSDKMTNAFDWQGHRGARGLVPENTIPAFLKALEFPKVKTLEMDVVISSDRGIMVSHDPWMSAEICSHPNGNPVTPEEQNELNLFKMTTDEIGLYDSGLRPHSRFPQQQKMAVSKPTLKAVVATVNDYCKKHKHVFPQYNIEIKSQPDWDNIYTPTPDIFAQLVVQEVKNLGIKEKTCIQSFDIRSLKAVHAIDPTITLAYLVETPVSLREALQQIGFTPNIYSPYYGLLSDENLKAAHEAGMKVIPWTVNDPELMKQLILRGVDGIITDYPNLIPQ